MNIVTSDSKYSISVGGTDTWQALSSTIRYHLASSQKQLPHVFDFLKYEQMKAGECLTTAREFNLVRDALSKISPDEVIYDEEEPKKLPPWGKNISPVVTSCGNYFTSGDGNDLLAEIVKVFTYAAYAGTDVRIT